jgi:hypothetical protein
VGILFFNAVVALIMGALFGGCFFHDGEGHQSKTKDLSLHLNFYTATLNDLEIEVDLKRYIDDQQKLLNEIYGDSADMLSVTVTGLNESGYGKIIEEMAFKQMQFLIQSFHNRYTTDVRNSVQVVSRSITDDHKLKVKYNVVLKVGLEDRNALKDKAFYVVLSPQTAALKSLYQTEPECFPDIQPQSEADYEKLFYYYVPAGCQHKSNNWRTVDPKIQVMIDEKAAYPEYPLLWEDNTLKVAQFFTPASSMTIDDAGVYAYREFIRLMRRQWGEGVVRQGNLDQAYRDPLNNMTLEVEYTLADGKKLLIFLKLWDANWKYGDGETKSLFIEKFNASDYISFNGHAGYGANVHELNSWINIDAERYHVYYINSCWSYSHNNESSKMIDFIGNIRPSYFHLMARQNFIIIKGLTESRSFQEILLAADNDPQISSEQHNPHLAIVGEENNLFNQ